MYIFVCVSMNQKAAREKNSMSYLLYITYTDVSFFVLPMGPWQHVLLALLRSQTTREQWSSAGNKSGFG